MQEDIAEVYIRDKKEECIKLIEYNIWNGIDSNQLKSWFKNFNTINERFFAACVLDWLVYRSDKHVIAMLYDLLTKHLHNQWRLDQNPLYNPQNNPLNMLQEKWGEIGFRYVTAVRQEDKDTKSGYHIAGEMNHNLQISTKWNIRNSEIQKKYEEGIRTFIFVDDLIGTGEQMNSVLEESQIYKYTDIFVYVLVCAGHEIGVNEVKKAHPNVKILCAEYIPKDSNLFYNLPANEFEKQSPQEMHDFYAEFMKEKGVKHGNVFGKGDLGMTYAFQHNVPNDSLPILYENEHLVNLLNKRGN